MTDTHDLLKVLGLGRQGDGLAEHNGTQVAIAGTLPGEQVRAVREGKRAQLLEIMEPSADRVVPSCPHFGACGGCRLQHLSATGVAGFKRDLVRDALARVGIKAPVAPVTRAYGLGRRRVTLHAGAEGAGYHGRRSHRIHPINDCPVLASELQCAPAIARAVFKVVGQADVALTVADNGLDVGVRTAPGTKPRGRAGSRRSADGGGLISVGRSFGLARLVFNGELVWQIAPPVLGIGSAIVPLPIGGFLQPSAQADEILGRWVLEGVGGGKRVADLFCGVGPFALRLAERTPVFASDSSASAIEALEAGWRTTPGLRKIKTEVRDLFDDPLEARELQHFDTVVMDPPRAGAGAQAKCLAGSDVATIVSVSCDPISFARDAAILCKGGYGLDWVRPLDQFEHAQHVEIVGLFNR